MIVNNTGYIKIDQILEMAKSKEHFSIYTTNKKTVVLVKNTAVEKLDLFYPKKDRLPYKSVEGRKIVKCNRIFNSAIDNIESLEITKFNNANQIMSYEEFNIYYNL